jgi:hypothetical protein
MIYSRSFQGLPVEIKQRIYARLLAALSTTKPDPRYAYLPAAEKKAIRAILEETLLEPSSYRRATRPS